MRVCMTKNIILFVVASMIDMTHASFANIPNVRMLLFDQRNAYDLSNGKHVGGFKKRFRCF